MSDDLVSKMDSACFRCMPLMSYEDWKLLFNVKVSLRGGPVEPDKDLAEGLAVIADKICQRIAKADTPQPGLMADMNFFDKLSAMFRPPV